MKKLSFALALLFVLSALPAAAGADEAGIAALVPEAAARLEEVFAGRVFGSDTDLSKHPGLLKADNVKRAEGVVKEKSDAADVARANLNIAIKNRMKIDEHRAAWLAEDAKAQEARAEGELEDFTVRKEEI